jgi:hypothetical protein
LAPGVIYSVTDEDTNVFGDEQACLFGKQQLDLAVLFMSSLWLIRDNAVNIERAFVEHHGGGLGSVVTSDLEKLNYTNASGGESVQDFSEEEMRAARDIFRGCVANQHFAFASRDCVLPSDFSRIQRVSYFTAVARTAPDLGNKVAGYVTCFEALLSTDASELAHKLAERLAFFCGTTPAERYNIYTTAKTAYAIRSKVVHGDRLSAKLANQAATVSQTCDELLRRCLLKIYETTALFELYEGPQDRLEEFFTKLVFGLTDSIVLPGVPVTTEKE